MKPLGQFDNEYAQKVRTACWEAIEVATHDSSAGGAVLRNIEICQALLDIQAKLMAMSESASSNDKVNYMAGLFAEELAKKVIAYRLQSENRGTHPVRAAVRPQAPEGWLGTSSRGGVR
jgi:hypothetical protein